MNIEPFDCCGFYNDCSDLGKCVWEQAKRDVCTYWIRHLSKGVAFYGKNPGYLEGHIFINIGGRAFRISKRKKDYSYIMDRDYINTLVEALKQLGISYSTRAEGECVVTGCPEDPAKYKLDFVINDYEYTIKNYNGWALEASVVRQIINAIGDRIKLTSNPPLSWNTTRVKTEQGLYYGKETVIVYSQFEQSSKHNRLIKELPKSPEESTECIFQMQAAPIHRTEENIKLPSCDDLDKGKMVQISIWDVMWGRT